MKQKREVVEDGAGDGCANGSDLPVDVSNRWRTGLVSLPNTHPVTGEFHSMVDCPICRKLELGED